MIKKLKLQQGTVLLLSLLVMASIITISLATGTLISNEIQQSGQLDRAMVSFYAAETGLEKALYQLRRQNFDPQSLSGLTEVLPNNAEYEVFTKETEAVIYANLEQDQTLELDLYQPATLSPLTNPIKSLRFSWQSESNSWLEVRWLYWTTAGLLNPNPDPDWLERGVKISLSEEPYLMNLKDGINYLYKVRITARYANVNNLQVLAYDMINPPDGNCTATFPGPGSECSVDIPQRIKIKGVGEFPYNSAKASKLAVMVTLPGVAPLAGLYDYVLFSEEEITK